MGCAFINIFTDASLLIEIVASWTFTLETAKGVHTVSTLAETWQLLALIDILQDDSDGVGFESLSSWTESLIFRGVVGRAQFTGVSPGSSLGAATRSSGHTHSDLHTAGDSSVTTCTDIQEAVADTGIHAAHTSGVELKVRWTVTQVAPRSVHTQPVDAVHRIRTLVDVSAVSSAAVQFITIIAHTAEHPWKVLARAKHADVLEITLIDVLTSLAVFCRSESHLTLAAVAARSIQTLAVFTQVHIVCTLIHIRAGKAVSIKALLTCAPVGSWCVDTVCVRVAVMVLARALILIHTLDAISNPTISTATFKASRHVDAGSMHVAVMSPDLTLINICATRGSLLDKVSQLTVADEGAFGVLTVTVETDVWVQITLIYIDTGPHVHRSHEPIVTQTAIFPRNVGTLASIADVWSLLTLINI